MDHPTTAPYAPWALRLHDLFQSTPLDEDDPRAPTPAGFVGALHAPQATLLAAMLSLEACPYLAVRTNARAGAGQDCPPLLHAAVARVAAGFSFGKTVLCVCLVCASPAPRATPRALTLPTMDCAGAGQNHLPTAAVPSNSLHYVDSRGRGPHPALSLEYSALLPATLVVAAAAVITQWESCIRQFAPHLSSFTVENVHSLRAFLEARRRGATMPDLVLLKAGKVTASFVVPGEPPQHRSRSLTRAIAAATEGAVWARLIIDDFDTIHLEGDDILVPALFTWVISATLRSSTARMAIADGTTSAGDFVRAHCLVPVLAAAADVLFDGVLKIHCKQEYVDEYINTTLVRYRLVVVEGGRAAGILQDLGVADHVVEMAGAGAVCTAAEALGIVAASVGDIVARVLSVQVTQYRNAARVLARVAAVREAAAGRAGGPPTEDEPLNALGTLLAHGDPAAFDEGVAGVGAMCEALDGILSRAAARAEATREQTGSRLARMRDNVRQGCCQACTVPIEDESYIVNCCQIVVCGYCVVDARKQYIKRCPNCAAAVAPRQLIYVGRDLDLETTLSDDALIAEAEAVAAPAGAAPAGAAPAEAAPAEDGGAPLDRYAAWADNPRLRALLQLVLGDPVAALSDEEVPPFVTGLLLGHRDRPPADGAVRKYLVFAMHPESARHIEAGLTALRVPYGRLQGKRKEKDATVARFKDLRSGVNVLVAASSRDCAGLHIPETTTVIMYNRHTDRAVAEQAIGRAQRVGRTVNLQVIEIVAEGEVGRL